MLRPPRPPGEQILQREHWIELSLWALAITASVLVAFWVALNRMHLSESEAVTVSFLTLAFAQLWHVFNMRSRRSRLLRNEITSNPWVWGALAFCVLLLLAATYIPPLARVLGARAPSAGEWMLILGMSAVPAMLGAARPRPRQPSSAR